MSIKGVVLACTMGVLAGCASFVEGTEQEISVNLEPQTAVCSATREGARIGSVSSGMSRLRVSKSRNPIDLECAAPGYVTSKLRLDSELSDWGLAGCFIDLCATDYSTGALNAYPETVSISLEQAVESGTATASTQPAAAAPAGGGSWRTLNDMVYGYGGYGGTGGTVVIPSSVPLAFVGRRGNWGLFEYLSQGGVSGRAWIALVNVRRVR